MMNENQEKKRNKMAIVGLLVLIAALVIGIKLIFAVSFFSKCRF